MAYSENHLYFDDMHVGQEWESGGRTVTETDIVNFAGFSGDFNPIHIDHEFAASTPFRRPIAHGIGVFCIASGLSVLSPPVRTIALLGVRNWLFILPVFPGDTVHTRTKVVEKTLDQYAAWAHQQVGRVVHALAVFHGGDFFAVIDRIKRHELPRRLLGAHSLLSPLGT